MTRFTTSGPQRPFYESRPYQPSPARREHIHGPVQPMDSTYCRDGWYAFWGMIAGLVVVAYLLWSIN